MDVCFYIFLIGIIFGSFFNVVGIRLPQGKSFLLGRSSCPNCSIPLQWYELIPLISYIKQRGQCSSCSHSVSPIYPIIELLTGCLFLYSYLHFGLGVELLITWLFMSFLIIITVSDLVYMVIPNKLLLCFFSSFLLVRIFIPLEPIYDALFGAIVGYSLIAFIIIISKGGMGAGDMKLLAVLGLVIGSKKVLLTFFIAVWVGAIIGLIFIYRHKGDKKTKIPFAPFLVFGAIISYFYGETIIGMYLATLN